MTSDNIYINIKTKSETNFSVHGFLKEIKQQPDASEFIVFSTVTVTSSGYELLSSKGSRVIDPGVQSASVARKHAEDWLSGYVEANSGINARQKIILVFDETVPKYNLFTGELPEHFLVSPSTDLTVADYEDSGGMVCAS